ncbi:hypothetical protein K493DRAFT_298401 [Basidiobolus meristosporus CBS 931.73]|uniref:BRCT domain-containing protein n=1 Tax=Basidiobolus meristosporus CBS 931.73 TaxID=1314790 RepID=A0A1Y1YUI9_9FUNG|nr:hypothetical protein K493DRAFT_298401 [Basidiobolus meristosporus CBS 931.73]|eukprot:ORY01397.1 hypothetical protein K493DRAFT_298401 [Basidiobolus meristosporus CBS 931.73]
MDKFVIRKRYPLQEKTTKTLSTENVSKPSIKELLNVGPCKDTLYKSNSTGHQTNESQRRTHHYWEYRHKKLQQQKPEIVSRVLKGVVVYVDGYLNLTMSDLEFKKLIQKHGGELYSGKTESNPCDMSQFKCLKGPQPASNSNQGESGDSGLDSRKYRQRKTTSGVFLLRLKRSNVSSTKGQLMLCDASICIY